MFLLSNQTESLIPIFILTCFVFGFVGFIIFLSSILGPKRKTSDKLSNFTSGINSHGNAREKMPIKFFLVAILFVLFDVEIVFFYPYAVIFKQLKWFGFIEIIIFVALFLVGYFYIIKSKALEWQD